MSIIEKDLSLASTGVIAEMEQKFPIMTEEFKRIQQMQYELFCASILFH